MNEKLDFLTECLGWAQLQPETPALAEWKRWATKRITELFDDHDDN